MVQWCSEVVVQQGIQDETTDGKYGIVGVGQKGMCWGLGTVKY